MRKLLALLLAFLGPCELPARGPAPFVPAVKDARCAEHARLNADVDGDGRQDTVFHSGMYRDNAVVGVCFATGRYAAAVGVGMGEALVVLDVDGDGAEEVLPGGTSSDGAGFDVLRYENGRLVRLGLMLERGHHDPAVMGHRHAWGCDGPGRLVQVEVDWAKRVTTLTTYVVRGSSVTSSKRTQPVPPDVKDKMEYPFTLVTQCGRSD